MAKAPARAKPKPKSAAFGKKKATPAAKKTIAKVAQKAPVKSGFDSDALTFETPLAEIEKGLEGLSKRFEGSWDGKTEPWDWDADYILAWWTLNLPEAKRRGVKTVFASARERGILGIYKRKQEEE